MKRMLIILLSFAVSLAVFSGCGTAEEKTETGEGEQKTVQVYADGSVPLAMTVAQTKEGCAAFEYRTPNEAYCFYAYDSEGKLYRLLWSDFEGLAEQSRVAVEFDEIQTLTYTEPSGGGFTPAYEIKAVCVTPQTCLSCQDGVYKITLPESKRTFKLRDGQERFVPWISDALVREAEGALTEKVAPYDNHSGFYLQITEDYLCLTAEVIRDLDEPDENVGCFDHEHLFFSERISSVAVAEQAEQEDLCALCGEAEGSIVFFGYAVSENEVDTFVSNCEKNVISEQDQKGLSLIYRDRERWTDDSTADRKEFCFDGYVHFSADGKCGRMYFGFEDNVLYYDGCYTQIWE